MPTKMPIVVQYLEKEEVLGHLRPILINVGLEVIPPQCSVGNAYETFDKNGNLADERSVGMMKKVCSTLCRHAVLLSTRSEP